MTTYEFETAYQMMQRLWPGGQWNDGLREAWLKVLIYYPLSVAKDAIQEHWANHGTAFRPDPKMVRKTCKELDNRAIDPKQVELLKAWPTMTALERCRYSRDSYAAQARKAHDDRDRERLQSLSSLYASHAARLYKLHAEDCPPRYGDRTMMPEPWGQDARPIGHAKREPEALNLAAVAAAAPSDLPF